jgi:hypothetical protein
LTEKGTGAFCFAFASAESTDLPKLGASAPRLMLRPRGVLLGGALTSLSEGVREFVVADFVGRIDNSPKSHDFGYGQQSLFLRAEFPDTLIVDSASDVFVQVFGWQVRVAGGEWKNVKSTLYWPPGPCTRHSIAPLGYGCAALIASLALILLCRKRESTNSRGVGRTRMDRI